MPAPETGSHSPDGAPVHGLETALRKALSASVAVILAFIAVICFIEVVLRYGFGQSFGWYDEFVGYLLVWLTFLGAVLAQAYRQHIGIDNVLEAAPPRLRLSLSLLNHALILALHGILLVYGSQLVSRFLNESAITLPIPMGAVYTVMPASAALMIVVELFHIGRTLRGGALGVSGEGR